MPRKKVLCQSVVTSGLQLQVLHTLPGRLFEGEECEKMNLKELNQVLILFSL